MSYRNFVPRVWAVGINKELDKNLVFAENTNREYEGNVKKQGDSVRILGVGKPTITTTTDKNIVLGDAENVEDTSITMTINQIAYFNYKVDDIDKRQAKGNVMQALAGETSEGIADVMDKYIANLSTKDEALLDAASAYQITKSNILTKLDEALQALYERDVKPSAKITATVPPWFYMLLKQAYVDLDTDNSKMLENGRVGRYGNVIIKMSNNVAENSDKGNLIQIKTDRAIAFCKPFVHTEPYRPEKGFSDAVKGFTLYDAKIVRPKEMVVMNVKK